MAHTVRPRLFAIAIALASSFTGHTARGEARPERTVYFTHSSVACNSIPQYLRAYASVFNPSNVTMTVTYKASLRYSTGTFSGNACQALTGNATDRANPSNPNAGVSVDIPAGGNHTFVLANSQNLCGCFGSVEWFGSLTAVGTGFVVAQGSISTAVTDSTSVNNYIPLPVVINGGQPF